MKIINFFFITFLSLYILGCNEKTTFSGKIINQRDLTNINISNKSQLLDKFGEPSYIDTVLNKYFYYTEMSKSKNFYNEKIQYSYLFIFELDKNDKIIKRESINLLENDISKYNKKETKNNIIKRGLIEKIFGGVGPNKLPDSPQN